MFASAEITASGSDSPIFNNVAMGGTQGGQDFAAGMGVPGQALPDAGQNREIGGVA